MKYGFGKLTIVVAAMLAMSGCLKPDSSSSKSDDGILYLTGKVLLPDGNLAANTLVFTDQDEKSRVLTNESGEYRLTLRTPDLAIVGRAYNKPKQTFHLLYEMNDGQPLRAISRAIDTNSRGNLELETTTLRTPANVTGKIIVLREDQQAAVPAEGVKMLIGRSQITTGPDGSFSLTDVPAGKIPVRGYLKDSADLVDSWLIEPGENKVFAQPLVMFPQNGVHGLIQLSEAAGSGHPNRTPYTKTFIVRNSPQAAYFRYHHRRTDLEEPGKVAWRPVQGAFDYDFTVNGGHNLFYQFANHDQQVVSQLYSLQTIIDPLGSSKGFIINDGSGVTNSLDLTLNVDIPETAFRMRIAETELDLRNSEWRLPEPVVSYRLRSYANLDVGARTIYLQFADVNAIFSPVYTAAVQVRLWPVAVPPIYAINNGEPVSATRLVRLDIQVPTNAYEMQIFEAAESENSSPYGSIGGISSGNGTRNLWLGVRSQLYYKFQSAGMKVLYLQFRTADQITSPLYQQTIRVDPFPENVEGFVINGGAPYSKSRHLDISLLPPAGSVQFKISESPTILNQMPWLSIVPNYVYSTISSGLKTIYVTYRNIDGDESPTFTDFIDVNAFPSGDQGNFSINGGAIATISPKLNIQLNPPTFARYFAISEGSVPLDEFTVWRELQPNVAWNVQGTGSKSIFVRYRSDDGYNGPAIQQVIFYDPFPFGTAGVTINNGATTTTNSLVNLSIYGEVNLKTMRISHDIQMLQTQQFMEYRSSMTYQLPSANGVYKVYIQFATAMGEYSPIYFSEITKTDP